MRRRTRLVPPVLLTLLALGTGCSEQGSPGEAARTGPAGSSASSTAATGTSSSARGGDAQFRPVVGVPGPAPDGGCDRTGDPAPEDVVSAPDAAAELCYELGPALLELDGRQTAEAFEQPQTGETVVVLELPPDQAQLFGDYTATHLGEQLAVLVDGTVISAPVIQSAITDGAITVTGDFTTGEAEDLAERLGGS